VNFGGAPDKLLDMARNGDIVLVISDPIVEEVTNVLRDKFGWTDEAIKLAQARIADFTEKVQPRRSML
jgi:predicted nucleic acid-binding protein